MSHRGTPSSPIPVEDSEDEVLGSLCVQDDELDLPPLKRKRDPAPAPPHESKKARKRRRRLERQAIETGILARAQEQQRWYSDMSSALSWNPVALYQPPVPLYQVDDEPGPSHRVPQQSSASDWVSAMALAGSFPNNSAYSTQFHWPTSPPALLERVSSPSPPQRLPKKPPPPLPPPPTATVPVLAIGMNPDNDPNSKHGLFHFDPSNLVFNGRSNGNYIPNPACTIVMEQLPKAHRTVDFCKQWAKRVSGVVPLCIFVDLSSSKALVEFPSAKLARKAWESPRLGTEYAGLKPHQLKGKSRVDLIRVWWYRVDGVGAGAGVGEIEEGEIEGDAPDRKAQPLQQSESKKARKVRLARERLEKAAHRAAMRALAEPVQPEPEPGHQGDVDSIASSREASVVPQDLATSTPPDPAPAVVPGPALIAPSTITPAAPDPAPTTASAVPDTGPVASDPVPTAPDPGTSAEIISANLSEIKRVLLAKQRELEETIAKSKLEMSKLKPPMAEDNRAMEDRLRKLVLQSQKSKAPAAASTSASALSSGRSTPSPMGESIPAVQIHTSDVSSFSLEDLAVSFITETISTLKQLPLQSPPPQPVRPPASRENPSGVKEELAARQKRLEEYITESKVLMTQLTQARTKQERDKLLALMREKSRLMDEEKDGMAKAARENEGRPAVVFRTNWPTVSKDGGIMIISDDESEEEK